MRKIGDNFVPVTPVANREHRSNRTFCWNIACPCKEDQIAIQEVYEFVQEGILTTQEETGIVEGKML